MVKTAVGIVVFSVLILIVANGLKSDGRRYLA